MTHKNNKLRNKIWSLALCASMLLSCLPISAFAELEDGTCKHHYENIVESGHNYGEEEVTESTVASAPAYTAEDVKAMIDALPDVSELENMDNDELSKVHDKAQETVDAYESLTEDVQAELSTEVEKLARLLEYMAGLTMTAATEAQVLTLPSSNGRTERLSTFTYADGVTQYFTFNDHLYKIAYTNLSSSSFSFAILNSYGEYHLVLFKGEKYYRFRSSSATTYANYLSKDNLPTTVGGILTGYIQSYSVDASKPSITITCLELNNSPTWNWASDYSSASAVFTAKDYDVQVTVSATVSNKVTKYAAKCTEKDTVKYTATASFGGVSGTDTQTVANGNIGPHSLTYSASGNTITGYCSNNCGHKQTVTLSVDSSVSLLYSGSAIKPAKLEYSSDWWGEELEIKYADDCINPGSHSASITIGGATATQSFEIITPTLVTNDNYASLNLDSTYVGYYAISSAAELRSFASLINSDVSEQKNAVLLNNIDLNSIAWTPIGTESQPYTGTFDGNGKTITNLFITASGNNQGLFGVVSGGTVKNFTLKGKNDITATIDISDVSNIKSISNVGGVVGSATNKAVIENIASYVNITDSHTPVTYTDAKGTVQSIRVSGIGGIVGNLNGSTVSYCTYEGTLTSVCGASIAGIVGNASNSATVDHCTNKGNVTAENNSAHIGGIAGDAQTGTTVSYCINYGSVTSSGGDCIGGIVAYANQNVKIGNCGNIGIVTCTADGDGFIGGILGYINNSNFKGISNCFNYGSIVTKEGKTAHAGAILGYNRKSGNVYSNNYYLDTSCTKAVSDNAINDVYSMTADQFKSGEVAYKLNNGKTDGTQVWYQTCQSDSYPKLSGKTVYRGYICGSGSFEPIYANSMEGLIEFVSLEHQYNTLDICEKCGQSKSAVWDATEKVYKIYNLGQLQWFANYVNAGNTNINGKLMTDINASSAENLGIGTSSNKYVGCFDGNGYTLTLGLNSTSQYAALFPYVNGATIKKLTVKGSITTNQKFAASIVGISEGTTKIENCLSYVTITSTVSGDGTHGGLVANVNSGTTTINNCGFAGAINGSGTDSCGGFVGWSGGTTKISNSFVAATFGVKSDNGNTFSRGNNITVTDCYYLNALGGVPKEATLKSADQFASGEVAWLLNGSKDNGTWKQTLKTDATPTFSGGAVYQTTGTCEGYTNNESEKNRNHILDELGCCIYCNKYHEIDTVEKLLYFVQRVNAGKYDINAKLMADLDLTGQTWTPIAYLAMSDSATVGYTGIFDGNGHVISNITIITPTSATANGFFGIITTGTVKNLGIDTLTFNNNEYDHRAGGIAGQLMSGGTIENCFVVNSTIKSSSHVLGGIVGLCKGTVRNCYTANLSLMGYPNRFGGITGDYKDGSIVNCYTYHMALGSRKDSVGTKDELSQTHINSADFSSGKITWLLNGSSSEGVWKQNLGTEGFPNFKEATVYKTAPCEGYSNAGAERQHDYDANNVCKNCGEAIREEAVWNDFESVYEISNLSQLLWFADKVNGGDTAINGKLMTDIDASALKTFGISTSGNPYSGTFDGNGYSITIKLNSTAQYAALFPYVNGATIENLTVKGSITTNQKFASGIVGMSTDTTTFENCLSYVIINSSVSGDGTHGGFVANVSSGTTTIKNCGFIGAINGDKTSHCGGLVGYSSATTNIENSYVAANFSVNSDGSATLARGNNITITNCYYMYALGTAQGEKKNVDQFASCEVAWLLNGSVDNGVWKQTFKTDAYPTFSGGEVYKTTGICEGYTNNESEKNRDHVEENGVCKYCGKLFNIVPAIWNDSKQAYEIYSAAQLVWFSKLVNGTLDGVVQNQSASAILMADIDMSVVTDYVPIGGTTGLYYSTEDDDKGYQGIFDGNGHVIKNLSVKGSDTGELTYGVFGTLSGTVKHLGVENFTFTLGSKDCRAGGIAGQVLYGGVIKDCYVANSTVTATGKVAGGIAGCNYTGTIKNCFTYKVTVTGTRTGGIVGDNCGDNNSDRKGTVINCYTDESTIENSSRQGNVSGSSASMSASDFASGYVGYQLDGNRGLWKQTIGLQNYPTFTGDTIKVDGYNITGAMISAKITWTTMELSISFDFASSVSGVEGSFTNNNQYVPAGNSATSQLILSGIPDTSVFGDDVIGHISVNIQQKISAEVGDTVYWTDKTGEVHECVVIEKDNEKYTLLTSTYTTYAQPDARTRVQVEAICKKIGATRIPTNGKVEYTNYRSFMSGQIPKNGDKIPVMMYGDFRWLQKNGNVDTSGPSKNNSVHIFFVIEIPIS